MFTAAVLCKVSQARLLEEVRRATKIPDGWEIIAHHMTINMGVCSKPETLGSNVTLIAEYVASNEFVIAVRLSPKGFCDTANAIPHITVAVNRTGGGKPVMSNKLTDWKKIDPVWLFANVEECR